MSFKSADGEPLAEGEMEGELSKLLNAVQNITGRGKKSKDSESEGDLLVQR